MQICKLKSEFLGLGKFPQEVLYIFPGNVYINKKVIILTTIRPTDVSPSQIIWFSEWVFLTEKLCSEDNKMKYFYKRVYFTVIYTCYTCKREVINSKHSCATKS